MSIGARGVALQTGCGGSAPGVSPEGVAVDEAQSTRFSSTVRTTDATTEKTIMARQPRPPPRGRTRTGLMVAPVPRCDHGTPHGRRRCDGHDRRHAPDRRHRSHRTRRWGRRARPGGGWAAPAARRARPLSCTRPPRRRRASSRARRPGVGGRGPHRVRGRAHGLRGRERRPGPAAPRVRRRRGRRGRAAPGLHVVRRGLLDGHVHPGPGPRGHRGPDQGTAPAVDGPAGQPVRRLPARAGG
jgi:hypothetical protein